MTTTTHIKFGDGLDVTDEGAGVIRVDGSGGVPGATGPQGPAGPAGPNLIDGSTPTPLTGLLKGNGTDVDVAVAGTDYATPAQLGNKVDRDAVEAATNRLIQVKLAAGDTYPAFKIDGNGGMHWGAGGSTLDDTNLYRYGPDQLRTSDNLLVDGEALIGAGSGTDVWIGGGQIRWWGSSGDTYLYRSAAGELTMNGRLVGGVIQGSAGATRVEAGNIYDGTKPAVAWAGDTVMWRTAAAQLHTNAHLTADGGISLRDGSDEVTLNGRLLRQDGQVQAILLTINGNDYRIPLQPA